jgi:phytoene/squalene synthetase
MSVDACAAIVERGDPDRFAATMAAPVALRPRLWPLYAFNLEVARAPWVTQESMIAEMRLQWWRDVLVEVTPRAHEVAGPLHALTKEAGLPVDVLDRLIVARRWDIYHEPFGPGEFEVYLNDTAAGMMWLGARALGAGAGAEPAVRAYGRAAGMAAFLRAVPDLEARGRVPLADPAPEAVAAWAARGLTWLAEARAARATVPSAVRPALLAGWQAGALLRQVSRDPACVRDGRLGLSEFARRGRLAWQAISGRW